MQEPNSIPIQNDLVIPYPITNDNMSKIEPRHRSAPVIRKHNSVNVIIPPNTYNSHEISFKYPTIPKIGINTSQTITPMISIAFIFPKIRNYHPIHD